MPDHLEVIEEVTVVEIDDSHIEVVTVGTQGPPGTNGSGVPQGGALGQVLAKASGVDHDVAWVDQTVGSGGGGGAVNSVNGRTGVVVLNQDDIASGTTAKQFTATEQTKLAGIASGATQNAPNAELRDRTTHTGSQAIGTVTGLQTALDSKAAATDLSTHIADTSNPHGTTKAQLGLGSVDNTSDVDKPVSAATQSALDGKQPVGDYATNADLTGGLADKVDKVSGKQLSTEDYTSTEKTKLSGIEAGAQVNPDPATLPVSTAVQAALDAKQPLDADLTALASAGNSTVLAATTASFVTADRAKLDGIASGAEVNINADWNATSGDALILNKPTLFNGAYSGLTGIPSAFTPSAHDHAVGDITATGTASATTYLRGDGTWATPAGGVGGTTWGSITGTLTDQGDLSTALTAKADASTAVTLTTAQTLTSKTLTSPKINGQSPTTSLNTDIGTASLYYNNVYSRTHFFNATASISGATAGVNRFTGHIRTSGEVWGDTGFKFGAGASGGTDPFAGVIAGINSYTNAIIFGIKAHSSQTADLTRWMNSSGSTLIKVDSKGVFYPVQAATEPTYEKGGVYFDTTLNKLRVGGATGWETITSS